MKFGAVFPQTEIGSDAQSVRQYIQAVDEMGYDYLLAYDHVVGANAKREGGWQGVYSHESQFHEVLTLFAYAAALSDTLELATGVLILPQRDAALVAKQAAEVDLLSNGRLRLGVGIGWNRVEMSALGFNPRNRGRRIEEQIEVMRLLWTEETVIFKGKYHQLDDVGINPLPVQRPIPIWFGGTADVVLERAARLGDGWMLNTSSVEEGRDRIQVLQGFLDQNGRSLDDFRLDIRLPIAKFSVGQWEKYVNDWQKLGVSYLGVNTMGAGFTSLDQHLEVLRQFIELFE